MTCRGYSPSVLYIRYSVIVISKLLAAASSCRFSSGVSRMLIRSVRGFDVMYDPSYSVVV